VSVTASAGPTLSACTVHKANFSFANKRGFGPFFNGFTECSSLKKVYKVNQWLRKPENFKPRRYTMWTKPTAQEMRFGFEVTMYVMNK
jgi:coenzyme PQQ precursor peptide PqqA